MTFLHHRRRHALVAAAAAISALLLASCATASDNDGDTVVQAEDGESDNSASGADEADWKLPDDYSFELDDPKLELGDVVTDDEYGDYRKLALSDETELTSFELVDDAKVDVDSLSGLPFGEGVVRDSAFSGALRMASRVMTDVVMDSEMLFDYSDDNVNNWYDSRASIYILSESIEYHREHSLNADFPLTWSWSANGKWVREYMPEPNFKDREAEAREADSDSRLPNSYEPVYEPEGLRLANVQLALAGIAGEWAGESPVIAVTYDMEQVAIMRLPNQGNFYARSARTLSGDVTLKMVHGPSGWKMWSYDTTFQWSPEHID